MDLCRLATAEGVASAGAAFIHARAVAAISERGRFTLALSGGSTPWKMLAKLAEYELPWNLVAVVQVDERVAAAGDPERNLVHIQATLAGHVSLPTGNLHAMPVDRDDLDEAAIAYENALQDIAGQPPVLDVVHLGLGPDGHTASLLPDDPVLDVADRDVAIAGPYFDHLRMTLTYPIINRARHILWLITGEEKAPMLKRLLDGDNSVPAGRVSQQHATLIADAAAFPHHTHDFTGVQGIC